MITITVDQQTIYCSFYNSSVFASIIDTLKQHKCRYHATSKKWSISPFKYDKVIEDLENLDFISFSIADKEKIEELKLTPYPPELEISSERLLFHPELMKHPPLQGKPPNENFQKQDILRAINRNRYGMFLDMGLGKSYEAAAIIAHLRYYNKAYKVLLISSNIGALNVAHELKKFIHISDDDISLIPTLKKDRDLFKPSKNIAITTYNTFRLLCDAQYKKLHKKEAPKRIKAPVFNLEAWFEGKPGILLLDESHSLGNPASQQTIRVLVHTPFFKYRYLFTGTPVDKSEKLYPQLKILDPSLVYGLSYQDWVELYNKVGNKYSNYAINPDEWDYDKLKKLNERVVKDYAIYRDAETHLDLPGNLIKKLYVALTEEQRNIYEAFITRTLGYIKAQTGALLTKDILNAFPYMQMALDNPKKLIEDHADLLTPELTKMIKSFSFKKDHAKFGVLLDILRERFDRDPEDKGVIWVWHPATAEILLDLLKEYKPTCVLRTTEDRLEAVEQFKKDKDSRILIASILILNTSVTITEASFQVYLERISNYSKYDQSLSRIYRYGQEKKVVTYVPIADSTIDVVLDHNLDNKDLLNAKLLSKDFLSSGEWKQIFNATDDKLAASNFYSW